MTRPVSKGTAGKAAASPSVEKAMGTENVPGRKPFGMDHAQAYGLVRMDEPGAPMMVSAGADAAGRNSADLSNHVGVPLSNIADTRFAAAHWCSVVTAAGGGVTEGVDRKSFLKACAGHSCEL